ncbi:hypothetical protein LCGC14_0895820 [marine sediment metagenome]|uniref:Uncharacterized protein n=1 Tax=marine sediment metagenome TaxID=412755 RepID=A0A0F9NY16_9ZZZZ
MAHLSIVIGAQYSRLTVRSLAGYSKNRNCMYLCECVCGGTKSVSARNLHIGSVRSCGCLARESSRKTRWLKHGHRSRGMSPTYSSWMGMMQRCYRKRHPAYHRYGGRGITVCPAWHDFVAFKIDMGIRPDGLSLDRRDNDKGYDLGNCRWVTSKEQSRNRTNNHILTCDGKSLCISEWAECTGLKKTTIRERISRGWTTRDALTIPAGGRRQ